MRRGLLLLQSFACKSQMKFLLVATEIRIHFKGTEHTIHNLQLAASKSQIGSILGSGHLLELPAFCVTPCVLGSQISSAGSLRMRPKKLMSDTDY